MQQQLGTMQESVQYMSSNLASEAAHENAQRHRQLSCHGSIPLNTQT
jgi:hypothetical protein